MPLTGTLKKAAKAILRASVISAVRSRRWQDLIETLAQLRPDLSDLRTNYVFNMNDRYLVTKVRALHAFQVAFTLKSLQCVAQRRARSHLHMVDIGDSSGTHSEYLKHLALGRGLELTTTSVNIDEAAVERIAARGIPVHVGRAEDIHLTPGLEADLFVCYETLEHLHDPVGFLRNISVRSPTEFMVITVPYLRRSRIGLHHLRRKDTGVAPSGPVNGENTHLFELSPKDWKFLLRFSGWRVIAEDRFLQYPEHRPLRVTQPIWRRFDFEGFWGVLVERDHREMNLYTSW